MTIATTPQNGLSAIDEHDSSVAEAATCRQTVEKVLAGVMTVSEPSSACPRCHGGAIRPLGDARSSLEWYHCRLCDHLWAVKLVPRSPAIVPAPWGLRAFVSDGLLLRRTRSRMALILGTW